MNLLLGLVGGVALGLVQIALWRRFGASPDLAAVALALLLSRRGTRHNGVRSLGLLLGISACSLEPVGSFLLGGGIAAVLLVPARAFVFVESATTRALFGLVAAVALALGREAHAWLGLAPSLPWRGDALATPLLTALAVPILARAGAQLLRVARWSAGWIGVLLKATERSPPA
jgi:hypothetical protein